LILESWHVVVAAVVAVVVVVVVVAVVVEVAFVRSRVETRDRRRRSTIVGD
jgi:hypothetical protein